MNEYKVSGHEAFWLPEGSWKMVWNDEFDGKEDGKITEYLTARPEFILISTEVKGYRKAEDGHTFTPEAKDSIGNTFLVDYVRVFELKK